MSICRAKWKNIRDTYRKCLKRRDLATRSGAGSKRLPECRFFKELEFLSDSVSNKTTISNFTLQNIDDGNSAVMATGNSVSSDTSGEVPSEVSYSSHRESPTSCKEKPSVPVKKKFRVKEREDISTALDLQLLNHLKRQGETGGNTPQSDNEFFCRSLVPTLDRLDNKANQMAKAKIQQLLFDVEFANN